MIDDDDDDDDGDGDTFVRLIRRGSARRLLDENPIMLQHVIRQNISLEGHVTFHPATRQTALALKHCEVPVYKYHS